MIKNKNEKLCEIIKIIKTEISRINEEYRKGPDLYFYLKLLNKRNLSKDITEFLNNEENIELIYATLTAWDMNCRGAKMESFENFKNNLLNLLEKFVLLDDIDINNKSNFDNLIDVLKQVYKELNLMKSGGRLVSNSKVLHYLFPEKLMPMDRSNTLEYLYGNTGESMTRYFEINSFLYEIMYSEKNLDSYLDDRWNTTIPKLVDNAIILIMMKDD